MSGGMPPHSVAIKFSKIFMGEEISVVSVSGQAPGCVAIDRQGKALRPAILWMDRGQSLKWSMLRTRLGANRAETISGNTLDSYFGGLKWAWFRQNEPQLYDKTWKFLQANNYVSFRLTGEISTDPSQAGLCSPCFNLRDRCWDPSICELMGLDFEKLPPIFPSKEIIGQVTKTASVEMGLPVGIPVICGGGDFACACLGAGVVQQGKCCYDAGDFGEPAYSGLPKDRSPALEYDPCYGRELEPWSSHGRWSSQLV